MESTLAKRSIKRLIDTDVTLCRAINRSGRNRAVRALFSQISLLGNGRIWYLIMAALVLLDGWAGARVALQMSLVGIASLAVYWLLKRHFARERPFVRLEGIILGTAPLDRFSFPSGHTLHAVAFTLVIIGHYPPLAAALIPLTLLIALSRMILGLHYPSDVIIGAVLGALLAQLSFIWM